MSLFNITFQVKETDLDPGQEFDLLINIQYNGKIYSRTFAVLDTFDSFRAYIEGLHSLDDDKPEPDRWVIKPETEYLLYEDERTAPFRQDVVITAVKGDDDQDWMFSIYGILAFSERDKYGVWTVFAFDEVVEIPEWNRYIEEEVK